MSPVLTFSSKTTCVQV